jgi:TRAP transporter TAXI family solute receptor
MKRIFVLLIVFATLVSCSDSEKVYRLAAGGVGGTYYPVGAGIAEVISDDLENTIVNAFVSHASISNVKDLQNKKVDLALVQSNVAYWAYQGIGMFKEESVSSLRSICVLYPEMIQVITKAEYGFTSIDDLRGHTLSLGAVDSGNYFDAIKILEQYNIGINDIEVEEYDFSIAMDELEKGNIHAIFITSGIPTKSVVEASNRFDVMLLPFDKDVMNNLISSNPYYTIGTIPIGAYKGLEEDLYTLSTNAMLVVHEDVDEEDVYEMTKAIWENQIELQDIHPSLNDFTINSGVKGLSIDLHPGAERYYEENNINFDPM